VTADAGKFNTSHIGSTVAGTTNEQWVDIREDSVLTIIYQVR
jgi:hypothetical protein